MIPKSGYRFSEKIMLQEKDPARSIGLARGRNDAVARRHGTRRQLALHTSGFAFQADPAQFANELDDFVRCALLAWSFHRYSLLELSLPARRAAGSRAAPRTAPRPERNDDRGALTKCFR